jgi:hypothetical protein
LPQKQTDIDAASEMLGETVEAGIWLSRYRHRWYHELSTGTELDLIFVVLLLPVILVRWAVQGGSNRSKETGPVFAATTENGIVFFAGNEGVFRRHITHVYDRKEFDDITRITCDNSMQTPVRFVCDASPDVLLYYQGPRLALEEFISRST